MGLALPTLPLFADLGPSPRSPRRRLGVAASVGLHAAGLVLLILVPILSPEGPPQHRDYVRALLYAPPPPPPPPLPKGSPLVHEAARAKPVTQAPVRPALSVPADITGPEAPAPRTATAETEPWGSPTGSEVGVPEGMEGGVVGGTVGGVPGGVIGGVIGGTGDVPAPVMDYDRPPRLIRQTKPVYPQEAFVKKVEGTVLVEILIGVDGRIVGARVVRSVPALDSAALEAVRQWLFAPALKLGYPVATVAMAPVSFRIY